MSAGRAIEPRRAIEAAEHRYLYDADFHARVEMVVRVVEQTHDLVDGDIELVTVAAAVALDNVRIDPATGSARRLFGRRT